MNTNFYGDKTDHFAASAFSKRLFEEFRFTSKNVIKRTKELSGVFRMNTSMTPTHRFCSDCLVAAELSILVPLRPTDSLPRSRDAPLSQV